MKKQSELLKSVVSTLKKEPCVHLNDGNNKKFKVHKDDIILGLSSRNNE